MPKKKISTPPIVDDEASVSKAVNGFNDELERLINALAKRHGFADPTAVSISIVLTNDKLDFSSIGGFLMVNANHKLFNSAHIEGLITAMEKHTKNLKEAKAKSDLKMKLIEDLSGADIKKLKKLLKKVTEKK